MITEIIDANKTSKNNNVRNRIFIMIVRSVIVLANLIIPDILNKIWYTKESKICLPGAPDCFVTGSREPRKS